MSESISGAEADELERALRAAQKELRRLRLTYTSDPPAGPGWYWLRSRVGYECVVRVEEISGELRVNEFPGGPSVEVSVYGGLWAGPLKPPE